MASSRTAGDREVPIAAACSAGSAWGMSGAGDVGGGGVGDTISPTSGIDGPGSLDDGSRFPGASIAIVAWPSTGKGGTIVSGGRTVGLLRVPLVTTRSR
ncbi:MAG: hypothetical protein EHM88_06985 [Candidatus Rokuibacteriota bacterium]|nr:MAG: hypothetical protein EHM88_06985 [Candidatus Rokubacteria bacterium]